MCAAGPALDCDDGNVCTDDACDPDTGCTATPNTAVCDDGDACTTVDICAEGICVGGVPLVCDDGNICTDDACVPASGCTATPNTAPCDDGSACTTDDTENKADDPLFVNIEDTPAADLRLTCVDPASCSPCIDTGSNSAVPVSVTTDLDGNPRIVEGNSSVPGVIVDMGAYEFQTP